MNSDAEPYHWPPELLRSLIDVIPLICRSKHDVVTFLRSAGADEELLSPWRKRLAEDKGSVRKHEIVRDVVERLNEGGDAALRTRRELVKRVCEFEDFSLCWENDALRAKGLVATVRELVNRRDSFTRINQERERKRLEHQREKERAQALRARKQEALSGVKGDLYALFGEQDPWRRGKALESVMNRWFNITGILVREAFTVKGIESEGVVEQIDGMIELQGNLYLVEVKWHATPIGTDGVSQHLVRVFNRSGARGIFIASSGYTDGAIATCRESLGQITFALCELHELVLLLEHGHDLERFLTRKIEFAVADRVPFRRILCTPREGP